MILAALLAITGFTALGIWQIQRLHWKLDLIEQTNRHIQAPAIPATLTATQQDTYLHVTAHGRFLHGRETLIHATTTQGRGYNVITPLQTDDGRIILINRGFVPPERRASETRLEGQIDGNRTVTGLLRLSTPGGTSLQKNNPAANQWYATDITAIATTHSLTNTAPYYIDADASPNPGDLPIGGLTIINFPNNHLQYALTWFALAALAAIGLIIVLRTHKKA